MEDNSNANFQRIFKFDPNKNEGRMNSHIGWFFYDLMQPHYENHLSEDDKAKIQRIIDRPLFNYITGIGSNRLDVKEILFDLDDGDFYDKGFRILAIIFHALGKYYGDRGHKEWEKYSFKQNLKPETRKHFGDIFGALDK